MMTVADLRAALAIYPDDMPVIIPGYESGYDPIHAPREVVVAVNGSPAYDGAFASCDGEFPGAFTALALAGER